MIRQDLKSRVVFLVTLLCISLHAYYFYEISLAPFPPLGFIIFSLYAFRNFAPSLRLAAPFLSIIGLNVIGGIIQLAYQPSFYFIYWQTIVGITAAVMFGSLICGAIRRNPEAFKWAVRWVLILHIGVYYLQVAVFYTTGHYVDFLQPMTGEEQRYMGGAFIQVIRPTGLFNEPATFSVHIFYLMCLYGLSRRVMRLDRILLFGLVSMFFSFSLTGFVYSLLFIGIYLVRTGFKQLLVDVFPTAVLLFVGATSIYGVVKPGMFALGDRIGGLEADGSVGGRYNFTRFANESGLIQVFGNGIGVIPGVTDDPMALSGYQFCVNQLGVFFTGLFVWFALVISKRISASYLPALIALVALFSSLNIVYFHFWLLYFGVMASIGSHRLMPQTNRVEVRSLCAESRAS